MEEVGRELPERLWGLPWIKMWHDHIRSKEADKIEALEKRIVELESKGKEEKKEEEEFVETMGGKVKKGGD